MRAYGNKHLDKSNAVTFGAANSSDTWWVKALLVGVRCRRGPTLGPQACRCSQHQILATKDNFSQIHLGATCVSLGSRPQDVQHACAV